MTKRLLSIILFTLCISCGPDPNTIKMLTEACVKAGGQPIFALGAGQSVFTCKEKKAEEK